MVIKKLYLHNFLSYEKQLVEFDGGLNVLIGSNASGKTNLVEAIYLSSLGKTARNTKDKDLLNWSIPSGATLKLEIEKKFSTHTIEIYIDGAGQKRILIDSLPISRLGELLGVINIVFFSPDEMKLIKESPSDRRRFLDISLSQQSKIYFYTLLKYNKLLQQRNRLLKDYRDKPSLSSMVELVNEQLLPCAELIIQRRKEFVEKLAPVADKQHSVITGNKERLEIAYETEDLDFSDIKGSLKALYEKNFEKDKKLEYTTVGLHRDDLKIVAAGIDVRKYGSQGQQRTAVLSLKLAEIMMLYESTGEYPVLLLDDVLSELDIERQRALLYAIKGVQTIVTGTEFDKNLVTCDYTQFIVRENGISEKVRIKNV